MFSDKECSKIRWFTRMCFSQYNGKDVSIVLSGSKKQLKAKGFKKCVSFGAPGGSAS